MRRWVSAREGSSSSSFPFLLLPQSPHHKALSCSAHRSCGDKAALPPPWTAAPDSWGVAGARCRGRPPARACSFRGQTVSEPGAASQSSAGSRGTQRMHRPGWHLADTARPPGGMRGRLGGQPLPTPPLTRPRPRPAPSPPLERSPGRCWPWWCGLSRVVVVATVPRSEGSRRWRGARRPAGTAGVWPGRRGGRARSARVGTPGRAGAAGDRRGAVGSEGSDRSA